MEALFTYKDNRTLQWALSFTGVIRGQIFFAFVGDQLLYATAALIMARPCSAYMGLADLAEGTVFPRRPRVETFVSTESESSLIWQLGLVCWSIFKIYLKFILGKYYCQLNGLNVL